MTCPELVEERVRRFLAARLAKPTPPHADGDDVETLRAWIEAEDEHLFARAVASLDDAERVVLVLHYGEELDVDEIATLLKQPRDTVVATLGRAASNVFLHPEWNDRANQLREYWRRSGRPS